MNNQDSNNNIYDIIIRVLILLLIVSWCFAIMYPFLRIILWSLILALAIYPLHNLISNKLGGWPKMTSFIIILSLLLIVFVPSGIIVGSLVDEAKELKEAFENDNFNIPLPEEEIKEWPIVGKSIYSIWYSASVDIEKTALKYKEQLGEIGRTLMKGVLGSVNAAFQILLSLIIAGVLLTIGGLGESVRKFFRKVAGKRGDEYAETILITVGSVVKGVLGVAIILALIHGLILTIAGVPFAGIWTLLIFVLCVLQIPVLIVTGPIIVYIFATQDTTMAIIWTIALLIAGLTDNVLKPILLGKGAPVPMLVIFIGVIGGFIFSGFIGLFTGAIVLSIGYKLFIAWVNSNDEEDLEKEVVKD